MGCGATETCVGGACAGACGPNEKQCSGNGVQTCTASGQWGTPVACSASQTCVGGSCTGVCGPNDTQCSGNGVQACNSSGQWGAPVACSASQTCVSGSCVGVCGPGQTKCSGNGVETCNASGQWGPAVACSASLTCVDGACAGVCGPDQTLCQGNGVETCNASGQWGAPAACGASETCVSGACAGSCGPGQTQCSGNGVQTCSASGQWGAPVACGGSLTCLGGQCGGACGPNQTQCSGDAVQTCDSTGQWGVPVACDPSLTCVDGACVCTPGQTQCSGNGVETCDPSGQWGSPVDCGPDLTCVSGACTGVCGPGQTQCSGSGVETCDSSGQWGTPATCGAGAPFCVAGECSSSPPTGPLTISPLNDTIVVTYGQQTPTVAYVAEVQGPGGGQVVPASFSIDLGQVATVDPSTGILSPSGVVGGVAHVTATFGGQTASTPITVQVTLVQNGAPAGVDAGSGAGGNNGVGGSPAGGPVGVSGLNTLQGTPITDPSLAWLYPYNKTVWPQGVLPPLLQWTTTITYDAVYVQLQEQGFYYQGFFATPAAGQPFVNVPLLQTAWDTLCYSNVGDPVAVTLVFSSGGVAYGPISETWTIAQGSLTGTVYYQSYGTALVVNYPGGVAGPFGGATLAIKHGATSPTVVAGSSAPLPVTAPYTHCRVCHSVAARGSELVTQHGEDYQYSSAYALTAGYAETVMPESGVATYAFPAIYPDGTFLLSNTGPIPGINPPATSGLFSITMNPPGVGIAIASTGLPTGFSAATPVFSPDGTHIAFNTYGVDKKSLGSMDFNVSTSTFSNFQTLHTPSGALPDVFPSFLPTNNAVVFELETSSDGEFGATRSNNGTSTGAVSRGNLWWVDLATHTAAEARHPERRRLSPHRRQLSQPGPDAPVRADREPGPVRWLCVGGLHEPPHVRKRRDPGSVPERPSELQRDSDADDEEAMGRCDRPQRDAGDRSEPSGLLPSRPGLHGRQLTRLLGRRPVRTDRRVVRDRRRVLQRLLRPGG